MLDKMPREVRQRVELELSDLSTKITKLRAFIEKHKNDEVNPDVEDLKLQLNAMCEYEMILEKRLTKDSEKKGDSYINASVYDKLVGDIKRIIIDMRKDPDPIIAITLSSWANKLEDIIPKGEK